jgi:hypothetical protein
MDQTKLVVNLIRCDYTQGRNRSWGKLKPKRKKRTPISGKLSLIYQKN